MSDILTNPSGSVASFHFTVEYFRNIELGCLTSTNHLEYTFTLQAIFTHSWDTKEKKKMNITVPFAKKKKKKK